MPGHVLGAQVPLLDWWFLAQGTGFMEDSFSMDGEWADSLGPVVMYGCERWTVKKAEH